eukprot:augustus_masked-scaffold_7-processed-gene-3.6-mRNA-1 protein AED:0.03 eAED:0.03 QI:0/-1/0/1/-1/1/1/0/494
MATSRKLQTERDRIFKKIDEGIIVFDEIWDKVYSSLTQTQKEKYEGDLKKEIKKLQRLRETLKVWMTGNEFKDKTDIGDYKRKIERKMEQFKICERETKTKAYSKEGLKKAGKLEPEEEQRLEAREAISRYLEKLQQKSEIFEAEMESPKTAADKVEELSENISCLQFHIEHLEKVLRGLDNLIVKPDQITDLKENLEYLMESLEDGEAIYHDDTIYDDLNLEKIPAKVIVEPTSAVKEKKKKKTVNKKEKKKKKGTKTKPSAHEKMIQQQLERQKILEEEKAKKEIAKLQQNPVVVQPVPPSMTKSPRVSPKPTSKTIVQGTSAPPSPKSIEKPAVEIKDDLESESKIDELSLLEKQLYASYVHMPHDDKWTFVNPYEPQQPLKKAVSFLPDNPVRISQQAFDEMEEETLFFVFYHQQGTYNQVEVAKRLNRKQWRYNTKYLTWFKRLKEPESSNKSHEIGTYKYFDFEWDWCIKIKEKFTFEYVYLAKDFVE